LQSLFTTSNNTNEQLLPPSIRNHGEKKQHLSIEDVAEIRRLRVEDPSTWTVRALAEKFNCSPFFIGICTKAGVEHKASVQAEQNKIRAGWGALRKKAREERVRRKEMLYRGEL
jgi:hypothetical protein